MISVTSHGLLSFYRLHTIIFLYNNTIFLSHICSVRTRVLLPKQSRYVASVCLFDPIYVYLSLCLYICLSVYLNILSASLSLSLSNLLFFSLSVNLLSIYVSVRPFFCLVICFKICISLRNLILYMGRVSISVSVCLLHFHEIVEGLYFTAVSLCLCVCQFGFLFYLSCQCLCVCVSVCVCVCV